jgi:site-specific recombinase XerD
MGDPRDLSVTVWGQSDLDAEAGSNFERGLTPAQFEALKVLPAADEWLLNNTSFRTRLAYKRDVAEFIDFIGIQEPSQFRSITTAHVIAYRDWLQSDARLPKPCHDSTVRRKLAALSSLFDFLCERHQVERNVVLPVSRPKMSASEGSTPSISDDQMRELLNAPPPDSLKGVRDRAILATLGYHGLRVSELCALNVEHFTQRDGVMQFKVHGKGGKIRYLPVHPVTQQLIFAYLDLAGHRNEVALPLFRPVRNRRTKEGLDKPLTTTAVYTNIVLHYAKQIGITVDTRGFCVHSMRVTFGTNAWEQGADIVDIQKSLGHSNISTTRSYLRARGDSLERSPTLKVKY